MSTMSSHSFAQKTCLGGRAEDTQMNGGNEGMTEGIINQTERLKDKKKRKMRGRRYEQMD